MLSGLTSGGSNRHPATRPGAGTGSTPGQISASSRRPRTGGRRLASGNLLAEGMSAASAPRFPRIDSRLPNPVSTMGRAAEQKFDARGGTSQTPTPMDRLCELTRRGQATLDLAQGAHHPEDEVRAAGPGAARLRARQDHCPAAAQAFLRWCMSTGTMPRLAIPPAAPATRAHSASVAGSPLIRKALTDPQGADQRAPRSTRPHRRPAGAALYAQPVSRIVRLTIDDAVPAGDQATTPSPPVTRRRRRPRLVTRRRRRPRR